MARSRNIKPGLYKNEDLAECSIWARYLYPGLWMLADREGRLGDRPKRIKGELLPFDSIDTEPLLQELESRGFIQRYTSQGVAVILIPTFAKHQNPHHREAESILPPTESPGLCGHAKQPKPGVETCMDPKPEALPPSHEGKAVLIPSSQIPSSQIPDSMPAATHAAAGGGGLTESDIWKAGVDMLTKANVPESQARTMLGKLAKDYGKQVIHEAVSAAVLEQPVDPRAYLRRICSAKSERAAAQVVRPNGVRAVGFDAHDYTQGVTEDGRIC